MYDVYLSGRASLLVVERGSPLPAGICGSWRKKKRSVRYVSEVIREDVQRQGYHCRRLGSLNPKGERDPDADRQQTIRRVLNSMVEVSAQTSGHLSSSPPIGAT